MVAHFDHHQYNYKWAKTISLVIILPLIIIVVEHANLVYSLVGATHYCLRNETNPSLVFKNNVDALLSTAPSLVSQTKSNFQFYQNNPPVSEKAYAMYFCPGIVNQSDCQACVSEYAGTLSQICPNHREAIAWYQRCVIKYSDRNFGSLENHEVGATFCTKQQDYPSGRNMVQYDRLFPTIVKQLFSTVASGDHRRPIIIAATLSPSMTIYGFAQCTPDLTGVDCMRCLRATIDLYYKECECKLYWPQVKFPSCLVEFHPFPFNQIRT